MRSTWILALATVAMSATMALAADWRTIEEVKVDGQPKEMVVNQTLRTVQIECTDGTVIVNTIWVREGAARSPITVTRRFNKGEKQDIDLGSDRLVTGFRIGAGGAGKYKILVK